MNPDLHEITVFNDLQTDRLLIRPVSISDHSALLNYYCFNRHHLQQWEPLRKQSFYLPDSMKSRIEQMIKDRQAKQALHYLFWTHNKRQLVAQCGFTHIIYGAFQACYLGFSVAKPFEGLGLMYEGLKATIVEVFKILQLHRIMANYQPNNWRSKNLLHRLGFRPEGLARAYLKINGVWTDHVLSSLIREVS